MIIVEELLSVATDCFFDDNELDADGIPLCPSITVEGITAVFILHKDRVNQHREEINDMLDQLPILFKQGWSFLMACNDKEGNQWTGVHKHMEILFVLGIAIGRVVPCFPRDLWSTLPGGMPYYLVKEKV